MQRLMTKTLKAGITGLIILILAAILPGLIRPTISWEQELSVDRPVKTVYFAFINPLKMNEWIKGFKKVEALGGFSMGAGSKYIVTFERNNKIRKVIEEVTVFKWREELGLAFYFKPATIETHLYFKTVQHSTTVTIHTTIAGKGPFYKTALLFVQKSIINEMRENVLNLENMLEGRPLNPGK